MAVVKLRANESQEQLLKRFRKKVVKSGVLSTVRNKRWFVSRTEQRRWKRKKLYVALSVVARVTKLV